MGTEMLVINRDNLALSIKMEIQFYIEFNRMNVEIRINHRVEVYKRFFRRGKMRKLY